MLFESLSADSGFDGQLILFKRDGLGIAGREVALHSPSRSSTVVKRLSGWRGDTLYWESALFAVAFALYSRLHGLAFEKILIIEPTVCGGLRKLRSLLPGKPTLVLTHGISDEPKHYLPFADEVHEVNVEIYCCTQDLNPIMNLTIVEQGSSK